MTKKQLGQISDMLEEADEYISEIQDYIDDDKVFRLCSKASKRIIKVLDIINPLL